MTFTHHFLPDSSIDFISSPENNDTSWDNDAVLCIPQLSPHKEEKQTTTWYCDNPIQQRSIPMVTDLFNNFVLAPKYKKMGMEQRLQWSRENLDDILVLLELVAIKETTLKPQDSQIKIIEFLVEKIKRFAKQFEELDTSLLVVNANSLLTMIGLDYFSKMSYKLCTTNIIREIEKLKKHISIETNQLVNELPTSLS